MKCKIYFIQCLETGEIYIGSTKQKYLSSRISSRKSDNSCSSKQILDRGNYIYDILEEVEECDRYTREQYYIDTTDNCINTMTAYKSKEQQRIEAREWERQYKLDNKDKLNEQRRLKYIQNKQKYTCECGQVLNISSKLKHEKRKRHQDYLKSSH